MKIFRKGLTVPKTVAQCRKYSIPFLNTLSRTIPYPNSLRRSIRYLKILSRTIPYLNTLSPTIPYFKTWQPFEFKLSANQNRVLRHLKAVG